MLPPALEVIYAPMTPCKLCCATHVLWGFSNDGLTKISTKLFSSLTSGPIQSCPSPFKVVGLSYTRGACGLYPEAGNDSQKLPLHYTTLRPSLHVGSSLGPTGTCSRGSRGAALWTLYLTSLLLLHGCLWMHRDLKSSLGHRKPSWSISGDMQWLFRCPTDNVFPVLELAAEH